MNAGQGSDLRRAAERSHDFSRFFHSTECSDFRNIGKSDVANLETETFSICCDNRYMLEQWAKEAIDASGLSQAEISRRMTEALGRSLDRAAINKVFKGKRKLSADEMVELARIAGVDLPEQLSVRTVPIVGYVSAGALAHYVDPGGELERVVAPEGSNNDTVAVEIRGDSLGSIFDRWLVFYDEVRSPVTSDLIGRLCVVGLADERVLVKKIQRSKTPGLYHLISNTEAPITDAEVIWAAKVKNMVPK